MRVVLEYLVLYQGLLLLMQVVAVAVHTLEAMLAVLAAQAAEEQVLLATPTTLPQARQILVAEVEAVEQLN
jgi:hypothetical protein